VGALGEVHPVVTEAFEVDGAAVYFEIDLMKFLEVLPERGRGIKPLARYPASLRDLSLLVDREVPAARVLSIIESQALVDRVVLFDAYEGEGVPPGKSSLAYRLHFQSPSKTLSSEEVGKALDKVVRALQRNVGAVLRGGEVEAVS
jgi:phenylalanyl-tRNA synthetase beta chain